MPVTLVPCKLDNPLPFPVIKPLFNMIVPLPNTALAVALPTVNPVNVPTLVILGCAAVVTVAAEPVASPVNAPTNVVLVTLVNPATVVTVEPKVNAVLPNVTSAFASLA